MNGTNQPNPAPSSAVGLPANVDVVNPGDIFKETSGPSSPPAPRTVTPPVTSAPPAPVTSTPPAPVTQPPTPVTTQPPAGVTMSPEQLQALARGVVESLPKPPAAPEPPPRDMTPQEQADFDRTFNVVHITPEIFQGIMGYAAEKPEQLQALEKLAHGIVRQTMAMATYYFNGRVEDERTKLMESIKPVITDHEQTQLTKTRTESMNAFYTEHPDLKDYATVVQEVIFETKGRGLSFNSLKDANLYVANKARGRLNMSTPSGTPPPSPSTAPVGGGFTPTLTSGRPGSNSSPRPGVAVTPQSIFGNETR